MRVLILHSDVSPDAPADEQDTLVQADAIATALAAKGHDVARAVFQPDRAALKKLVARERPDVVFNLVEAVWGKGSYAGLAVGMLAELGVAYTGVDAAAMAVSGDKILAKRLLAAAGLPTPDWAVPPDWDGVNGGRWIVKSVDEDCSLALDDEAVVDGRAAVLARANACAATHGGRWFAESFIEGREFNVPVIEEDGAPRVLPIPELRFENWNAKRPRIAGHAAKWDADSPEFNRTVWNFAVAQEPALCAELGQLAIKAFELFGVSGYARVDIRVDGNGRPFILEINPNPCLSHGCGLAAAAAEAKLPYAEMIEKILRAARQ